MYDLKICLKNDVELLVIYDKQSREIMVSLFINGVEIASTENPISAERISPKNIKKDFGLIISDIDAWLTVVDNNSSFEKSTVWQRN